MTQQESSYAADSITAALVQGLHAFMASEAKAAENDTQLEAAAKPFGNPSVGTYINVSLQNPCCARYQGICLGPRLPTTPASTPWGEPRKAGRGEVEEGNRKAIDALRSRDDRKVIFEKALYHPLPT